MTTEYKFYKNSNTGQLIKEQIFSSKILKFPNYFYDRNGNRILTKYVNLTGFVEIKEKKFKREIRK